MHALKDTAVQAEARAWFFEHFEAATYAELEERYPRGSRGRHLLAEFLGFFTAGSRTMAATVPSTARCTKFRI
jgi:hypothetical protein